MPVMIDVQSQLDKDSVEKVAAEIRRIAKQAVLDGVQDAIAELFPHA